jgi:hypothetical protein
LVVLTMIAMAVSGPNWWGRLLAILIEGGTFLFILLASAVRPRTFVWAAVLVGAAITVAVVSAVRGGAVAATTPYGIGALLSLVAPVVIVRRLLATMQITASTILGALCLYLLAGLFFAYVFHVVGALDQGQFFTQTSSPTSVDYLYFSLVTLATLGYGDLTASSSLGKMLSVTEALAGQLYLVSVVAVLVSNLGRPRRQPAEQGEIPRLKDRLSEDGIRGESAASRSSPPAERHGELGRRPTGAGDA